MSNERQEKLEELTEEFDLFYAGKVCGDDKFDEADLNIRYAKFESMYDEYRVAYLDDDHERMDRILDHMESFIDECNRT